MKKFLLTLIVLLLFVGSSFISSAADEQVDEVTPIIDVVDEDELIFTVGSEIDITEYFVISDDSENVRLISIGEINVDEVGEYIINLIAIDASGNSTNQEVKFTIVTEEEMAEIIRQREKNDPQKRRERILEEMNAAIADGVDYESDAYTLALSFLGMGGSCTTVAQAFINAYFGGGSIYSGYQVSASDALPGDVIYYANGGVGYQHYAIYLGGGLALHGNWKGTTVISDAWLANASEPIFYRVN